eukprot:7567382-Alexandrium_andersonii.AAC.1
MSASLVGSEMCIRDRDTPAAVDFVLAPGRDSINEAPDFSRCAGDEELCSCLLYTSDAADDMHV